MLAGDLVYHKDDLSDLPRPIPGLIVRLHHTQGYDEAIVYFTDRTFGEYHNLEDLIKVERYEQD